MVSPIDLCYDDFNAQVSGKIALLDFRSEHSALCRTPDRVIDLVAAEVDDPVLIARIDVNAAPDLADKFAVTSVPTLIVYKNARVIKRFSYLPDKQTLVLALKLCCTEV